MQPMELAEEEAEPCGGAAEDLGINLQNWAIDIKDMECKQKWGCEHGNSY